MPETVFTISGPPVEFMGGFGAPDPNEQDMACADHVKPLVITSAAAGLGGVGAGLFGVYKAGQRKTGTALLSFAAAIGLWMFGGKLLRGALIGFETCRGAPIGPPGPGAP